MNPNHRTIPRLLLILPVVLALVACGGDKPEDMIASAKVFFAKDDLKAAVIQIKNALQKDPNSAEARYLLGTALLESGDVVGAESELRKALELKYSRDKVVPQLARAMLGRGQAKKLVDEFGKAELGTSLAKADFRTSLALAYASMGKADLAEASLAAALAAEPGLPRAVLLQARQKGMRRDMDGALALVDDILARSPRDADAWKFRGDVLLYGKGQVDDALAAYRKAIEFRPNFLSAHSGAFLVLVQQGKPTEAAAQVEAVKKFAPNHPQTKYFEAQLAYGQKNYKLARELAQQILKFASDEPKALHLAGAIELQLNSLVQAESYLTKALQKDSELFMTRRLLVATYLRLGQTGKALAMLLPSLGKDSLDPEAYSLAGEAYLQGGDYRQAEEYFAKAAKADPKSLSKRTSLALTRLVIGNVDTAFSELQEIASADPSSTADMALISAYLRRKEIDKALKAIDRLEAKQPGKPFAANLRGSTLMARNDVAAAKKSFESAVTIDPMFFPAVASLAAIDVAAKRPADAKRRFEAVLAKEPKHAQALLALATLAAGSGESKEEVIALLGKAITANPAEVAPKLMLIEYYLGIKDYKQASSTAQNAVATLPESTELLDALGRAQQLAGEFNQAITSYTKLVAMQPQSSLAHLRIADIQIAARNREAAAQSLRKALEIKPDLIEAQRGLIMIDLDAKRYPQALAVARAVQKQRPKEAVGYLLEGDIHSVQKNRDAALVAYRAGLKLGAVPELALKAHAAMTASGKNAEADRFAATWMKEQPKDPKVPFYLGDLALVRKDFNAAEKLYQTVLRIEPNNAAAYNNLAWVSGQLRKDNAVEYAEKAIGLQPNQPAFLDTLAMLLSEKNEYIRAVDIQTQALALQPKNALFRLNLAKIHIRGGKKELARKELEELSKLGDRFTAQAEVANLRSAL